MKYPEGGRVKTRLARTIGREMALRLYQRLVRRTLGIASDFKMAHQEVDLFLFYYPPEKITQLRKAYPGPWSFTPQVDGHLGEKMAAAFDHVFRKGYGDAVLVGTDIADLMARDIEEAFEALDGDHAALGPAQDGGFYLIGLKAPCADIFSYGSWSLPSVYERTLNCFRDSLLKVKPLPVRRDIDQEGDLTSIRDEPFFRDQVSIIIPFLGATAPLAPLIESLEAQLWPGDEIIMVKGVSRAPKWGPEHITPHTRVVLCPRGRGIQFNCGTSIARGDLLWFLHADTVPPSNFGYHIRKLSQASGCALGCFELSLGKGNILLRLVTKWANLRTRYFTLPYGDQGLFCSRRIFEKVGGFRKQYLMEDLDFVRACKKVGKLLIIPQPLYSSPERYFRKGILRASCENHLFMLLHFLGISDWRLYRLYYGKD